MAEKATQVSTFTKSLHLLIQTDWNSKRNMFFWQATSVTAENPKSTSETVPDKGKRAKEVDDGMFFFLFVCFCYFFRMLSIFNISKQTFINATPSTCRYRYMLSVSFPKLHSVMCHVCHSFICFQMDVLTCHPPDRDQTPAVRVVSLWLFYYTLAL